MHIKGVVVSASDVKVGDTAKLLYGGSSQSRRFVVESVQESDSGEYVTFNNELECYAVDSAIVYI